MELFKNANIDWVGKRWLLMGISAALILVGVGALIARKGPRLGIDFTGGTVVYVKFQQDPDLRKIRTALPNAVIQQYDAPEKHQVQIRLEQIAAADESVAGGGAVLKSLRGVFDTDPAATAMPDLNNVLPNELSKALSDIDPLGLKAQQKPLEEMAKTYGDVAAKLTRARDTAGILRDFNAVKQAAPELTDAAIGVLQPKAYLGSFRVVGVDSVGPVVGKDLQQRAASAVLYSVLAMLLYIGWRFKQRNFLRDGLIYGLGAIIAVVHDVVITVGLFSLLNLEISLTVIAALLTLVGYSVNDTIVIFDRIRENLKLMRKDSFATIINKSINQTLARTILTSFTVFLSVGALLLFGGEVLRGFSLALTMGIIVGSYSTLAIAAPILVFWDRVLERQRVKA